MATAPARKRFDRWPTGSTALTADARDTMPTGAPGATRPAGLTFEQALAQYQAKNPYTPDAFAGIFDYFKGLGFQVERPTHAGGSLLSDDKVVDSETGLVYDVILGVDGASPTWTIGNTGTYWFDGQSSATPGKLTALGERTSTSSTLLGGGTASSGPALAARRQRQQAGMGGRQSTILGGFKRAGAPTTRPTALGGY